MFSHQVTSAIYPDFWQYESSYREQPNVRYTRQLMVYLSGNNPGGDRAWGTFPNFVQLLDPTTIIRPLVRVSFSSVHVYGVKTVYSCHFETIEAA